jgi:cytochrome oxidase Cu insertion factor (SCO1/SenC/PrrC family)
MRLQRLLCLAVLLALAAPAAASAQDGAREPAPPPGEALRIQVPDVPLVDQHGRTVRLWTDLIRGQVVAINFIFTHCKTICSPMTATLARVQKELGPQSPVRFISITLDAAHDTPEKLSRFAQPFSPGPGWSFLTGEPDQVKQALVALGGYSPDKEAHRPLMLVGNATAGKWVRVDGLGSATSILDALREVRAASAPPSELGTDSTASQDAAAARYFTNTELVDQHGKPHRLYEDLIRGRKVLINFAFTACKGVCSPMTKHLAEVQRKLGDRVGKDITMITLSVDPANDTPESLGRFAKKFSTGPGWYFLTGSHENVSLVLKKLGGYTEQPSTHSSVLLIGDAATGTWVKAPAMSAADDLVFAVEHLNDPR